MAPWGSENDSGEEEVEVAEWWVVLQPGAEPESQKQTRRASWHLARQRSPHTFGIRLCLLASRMAATRRWTVSIQAPLRCIRK